MDKISFEDITNGKVQNPTSEQVHNAIEDEISKFKHIKEINDFLCKMQASDAYVVIRDIVQPKTNSIIRFTDDNDEYRRFQSIRQESKRVFDYEHKTATMREVQEISDAIGKKYYGIAIRMISTIDDELGKVEQAINIIEEHLGLSVTKFNKEELQNDTAESGNEQGDKETTN